MNETELPQSPYSLRLRLLKLISIPLLAATLIIGTLSFSFVYHEIGEVYDAELIHVSKTLYELTAHEAIEEGNLQIQTQAAPEDLNHPYEKNVTFNVWYHDDIVTQSPEGKLLEAFKNPGFTMQIADGTLWRIFVYKDTQQDITVQVAEKESIRTELIYQILGSLFLPAILFLPAVCLLVWLGLTWGLKPVIKLSGAIDKRDAGDLTAVSLKEAPQEMSALLKALNNLLARLDKSLRQEREFTDNAAHELRTPLAAMKTQVQVLMRSANLTKSDADGLANLLAAIDRGTHMVDQLLSFSRLQNQSSDFACHEPVDIENLIKTTAAELKILASKKLQSIDIEISENKIIQANKQALAILLRNLLENAIKFTPEGGKIAIGFSDNTLTVKDTGPGVADAEKEKIFQRFYRADKSGQPGSGLGLAMVKWIADTHGAKITLSDNTPKGLIISLTFKS